MKRTLLISSAALLIPLALSPPAARAQAPTPPPGAAPTPATRPTPTETTAPAPQPARTPATAPGPQPARTPLGAPAPPTRTTMDTSAQQPAANPSDVDTLDHIIAALYDVISGPAGRKRDWERFRSLFIPGARLIPTAPRRPPGAAPDAPLTGAEEHGATVLSPDDFIARSQPLLEGTGFFERESARRTEQYGHIAHVFSTYESRHAADEAKPFQRGVNSIQLVNDGRRWWVVTIFWEAETERTPLPAKYLGSGQ